MFLIVQDDDGVVVNRLEKVFWSRIWVPTLYLEDLFDMETRDSFKQSVFAKSLITYSTYVQYLGHSLHIFLDHCNLQLGFCSLCHKEAFLKLKLVSPSTRKTTTYSVIPGLP